MLWEGDELHVWNSGAGGLRGHWLRLRERPKQMAGSSQPSDPAIPGREEKERVFAAEKF